MLGTEIVKIMILAGYYHGVNTFFMGVVSILDDYNYGVGVTDRVVGTMLCKSETLLTFKKFVPPSLLTHTNFAKSGFKFLTLPKLRNELYYYPMYYPARLKVDNDMPCLG